MGTVAINCPHPSTFCGVIAAQRLGAARVIALSRNPARQQLAQTFGATDIVAERGEAAIEEVLEMTDRIGVDAALECVGTGQSNGDRVRDRPSRLDRRRNRRATRRRGADLVDSIVSPAARSATIELVPSKSFPEGWRPPAERSRISWRWTPTCAVW